MSLIEYKIQMDMTNVLLTGGHAATTALSVIKKLKEKKAVNNIYWVGSAYAMEGSKTPTLESSIFPKEKIKCYQIISGRIQRRFTRYTILSLVKIPIGFIHALIILLTAKPDIILSFGGYAAVPVVVIGSFLGIPVVIHEQTIAAGRANLFSARFATRITLAREESKIFFPNGVVVGNPLLPTLLTIPQKSKKHKRLTIYVTGGSRGSVSLNQVIVQILDKLLDKYDLIHQTGELGYKDVLIAKQALPQKLDKKYKIYATIDPNGLNQIWEKADIVIARSGANTVSEVIATKTPSIFVPLPNTYNDEQMKNAVYAEKIGIAYVLDENNLNGQSLLSLVSKVESNWESMVSKASTYKNKDRTAASEICDLLLQLALRK